jgi:hypothetical protein
MDRDRTLRAIAARLERAAARARERGEAESALDMQEAVVDLLVLGSPEEAKGLAREISSGNLPSMTGLQLQRRGKAIAQARSAKSDDPLWKAITGSKWGSQEVYARKRLGVSPGSLSAYRSGNRACPRPIATKVQADFDIPLSYWRAGIVD